jgi:aspartate-semialdehyde dehydrogenase
MSELESPQFNIALVGASTLKGKEVKTLLHERGFPVGRLVLLDAEEARGQLTEFDEEPVIIQPVGKDSFRDMAFAVFASSVSFTDEHWRMAEESGCEIIDLSFSLEHHPRALLRAPLIESLFKGQRALGSAEGDRRISVSAHPVAMAVSGLLACLSRDFEVTRCAVTVLESVSEHGKAGIEELSRQTVNLLSFQEIPKDIFGAQVAFNLLSNFGGERQTALLDSQSRISRHIQTLVGGRVAQPAMRLLQAPIFYGHAFSCFVELAEPASTHSIEEALQRQPFRVSRDPSAPESDEPDMVNVAGANEIFIGTVERDPAVPSGYWIWGTLDNVRLAALNGVEIAEEKVFAATGRSS